jgi:PAS domain S-box-containing protein
MNVRNNGEEALRDSEERLRIALEAAGLGAWDCDLRTGEIHGDERTQKILGIAAGSMSLDRFFLALFPDDRERMQSALRQALDSTAETYHHLEVRVPAPNGDLRWVAIDGKVHFEGEGPDRRPVRCIGTVRDITHRRNAEEALRAAQARAETILRSISDAFFALDPQWQFVYVNTEAERLLRRPATELLGRMVWDVFPESEAFRQKYERAVESGQAAHFEQFYPPHNSWLEVNAYPSSEGLSVYFRDISGRKHAEEALRRSENRLRIFFDSDMVGTLFWDLNGRINDANERFLRTVGYSREELQQGKLNWSALTPPEFRAQDTTAIAQLKSMGVDVPYEKEFVRKDGSRVPIIIGAAMLDNFEGVAFVLDITERKLAETRLARDLEAMTRLQQVGSLFVREGDLQSALEQVVDAAIAISKADFGNIQLLDAGSGLRIAAQRGFPQWYVDFWNEVTAGHGSCGTALAAGQRVIVPDVEQSPIFAGTDGLEMQRRAGVRAVQSTPVISRSGKVLGMFSTHFKVPHQPNEHALKLLNLLARQAADIIEHSQSAGALRAAKEDLARVNQDLEKKIRERTAKLEETVAELEGFSYSLVHDMRAPLRAMIGYSSIVETEAASRLRPEEKDMLRRITVAATRMDQLITDSLSYSRLLQQDFRRGPVDVGALVRSLVQTYPNLHAPQADVTVDLGRLTVHGNEAALTQVFSNLLGNAVKFVAPGVKPRVRVWAAAGNCSPPLEQKPDCAYVWIEDNGIGIPQYAHEKIFEMFQRLHPASEYPGTGIGLALVRKSLERSGGGIKLESEPGKGSRFCVQLPIAEQEHKESGS